MPRNLTAMLVAAAVAGAGCDVQIGRDGLSLGVAAGRAEDTWTRSYPLGPGGRLEIVNVNGDIDAQPAEGAAVEIVAGRTARAATDEGARELLGTVDMREDTTDGRVRVEVRIPRRLGTSQVTVQWTVRVPPGVAVDLRTTNGRVAVSRLDGEVRASTVNGGIAGQALAASSVEASTVNGAIEVDITRPLAGNGAIALETTNGAVSLALPAASRATLEARVTNGSIRTGDLPFEARGETSRRRFEGMLNGGGTPIRLQTTNGGIRLSKSGG